MSTIEFHTGGKPFVLCTIQAANDPVSFMPFWLMNPQEPAEALAAVQSDKVQFNYEFSLEQLAA